MSAARAERAVTYTVLALFAVGAIYPVLSILFLALHTKNDLVTGFAWPTNPSLSSFSAAWTEGDFGTGLKSSFIVAAAVTVVSAVLSLGTGYAFGTMRFRGDRWLFGVFLLGIIFPYEATVIPLYYDFQDFGILNTYWSLILPQIGQSVAFGTFWMRAFFRSTPPALVEAARMDGASSFGVLVRVLLPQARPALLTLCALVFTYTWNEFLLALVLVERRTLEADGPARAQLLRRRRPGRRPDQGRGGVGAGGRADRDRVHLPPTALHPRDARGSGKGVGSGPNQAGVHRRRLDPRRGHDGLVHPQQRRRLRRIRGRAGRPRSRPARADPDARREDGAGPGVDLTITATTDRKAGLRDCDAVLSSFRPGGFSARPDERIPLNHGVIGQETQGPGGFFMALRAIAILKDICAEMEEVCPGAWLFNYTNPVNLVAEAVTTTRRSTASRSARGRSTS